MKTASVLLLCALALLPGASNAGAQSAGPQSIGQPTVAASGDQDIVAGGHEIQVYVAGGHSTTQGPPATSVVNGGLRYGWVITDPWGPRLLRNRFEYAVDVQPLFVAFEPHQSIAGVGFDPMVLKFNFMAHRGVVPYLEISGGALFTNRALPAGEDTVNFTPGGAFGISVPRGKYRWSAELRYLHISDAGLTPYNPGINILQLRVGFGRFTRPKE